MVSSLALIRVVAKTAALAMFCAIPLLVRALGGCVHPKFRVVVAAETFPSSVRAAMQARADEVASLVDRIIPGLPSGYSQNGIICFIAPHDFRNAPITLPPQPLKPGEPRSIDPHRIRIALSGILPNDEQRFVFQLSHELAHVKMDARYDSYLTEVFAVAVSLEVLKRFRFGCYRQSLENDALANVPPEVRQQVEAQHWPAVARYWQGEIRENV